MNGTETRLADRRSGLDRRTESQEAAPGVGEPSIVRWPIEVDHGFDDFHPPDPWVSIVHRCIADYRSGRLDAARETWDDRLVWRVDGGVPVIGADGVFGHHHQLGTLTDGTFRQHLVSLEGSGGPIVDAHVRTTARRNGRSLDIPTLIVFELAAMRIRHVTEMPGDQAAWDAFWSD